METSASAKTPGRDGFEAWLAGRRAIVFGLARSGQSAAEALAARGMQVTGVDEQARATLEGEWGKRHLARTAHTPAPELLADIDLFVLSPGIPAVHPFVRAAVERGIPVRSEIEIGWLLCPAAILAITGSKGKSTTTALAGALLAASGRRCEVAGNIGRAYCDLAGHLAATDWVALEVSSFQLETLDHFKADVAVLLGISPDHLDRYPSFEDYARAKLRIGGGQSARDALVVDPGDPWGVQLARTSSAGRIAGFGALWQGRGVVREDDACVWRDGERREVLAAVADVPLLGAHNLDNALAALAAVRSVGPVDDAMRDALRAFRSLPYRMQPAGAIAGIQFVNDSKGTTVEAVRAGVLGLPGTLLLALGGRNKDLDFTALRPHLGRVRVVFVYGESAPEIERALTGAARLERVHDLDDLVERALALGEVGDTFLFSPGCTSFDMFRNAEHRGEEFDAAVGRAAARHGGSPSGGTSIA